MTISKPRKIKLKFSGSAQLLRITYRLYSTVANTGGKMILIFLSVTGFNLNKHLIYPF